MWLRHRTLKRKIEKLNELNKVRNFSLYHAELQNKELVNLVQSYTQASSKQRGKILRTIKEIMPSFLEKRQKIVQPVLKGLSNQSNLIQFIGKNSFTKDRFQTALDQYGMETKVLLKELEPKKIPVKPVQNGLRILLKKHLSNIEITQHYISKHYENEWDDVHANQIKQFLESEAVHFHAVGQAIDELSDTIHHNDPPKNTTTSRRAFLKSVVVGIGYGAMRLTGFSTVSLGLVAGYLAYESAKLPEEKKNGLAIFIGYPQNVMDKVGAYFSDIYINRIQLALGFKAKKIFFTSTKQDFVNVVRDKSIQNIAILGHGDNHQWIISEDEYITNEAFLDENKVPIEKKGYFLKHTCGEDKRMKIVKGAEKAANLMRYIITSKEYRSVVLGDLCFPEGQIAHWDRITTPIDFICDPLHSVTLKDKFKDRIKKVN